MPSTSRPSLTRPGEPVTLRYAIVCAPRDDGEPCDGSGSVFVRAGQSGPFQRLALTPRQDSRERPVLRRPCRARSRRRRLASPTTRCSATTRAARTITVPAGGSAAPQRSVPLRDAAEVALGAHAFGRDRAPDERVVAAAWGSERRASAASSAPASSASSAHPRSTSPPTARSWCSIRSTACRSGGHARRVEGDEPRKSAAGWPTSPSSPTERWTSSSRRIASTPAPVAAELPR